MGVDYYACDHCGETFCDCGDYVSCEGYNETYCGKHWCSDKCANLDGYEIREQTLATGYEAEFSSCKYCRHEDVEDEALVNFLLKHFNIDRKTAIELYYKNEK